MTFESDSISTHLIFGRNLRELCRRVGTIAEVADSLDINRVQMNRILNGESFPKPGLMKRICEYFNVDARILLEPLSDIETDQPAKPHVGNNFAELTKYAFFGRDYFVPADTNSDILPDGLHLIMRPSFLWRNGVWASLVRFSTLNGMRVVRGLDPVAQGMRRSDLTPLSAREFRGMMLKSNEGICFLYAPRVPNSVLGVDHFTTRTWSTNGFLVGRCMIMSSSNPIGKHVVPSILQPLEQTTSEILRVARMSGFRSLEELPKRYHEHLSSAGL